MCRGSKLCKSHERIVGNLFNRYSNGRCPFKEMKLLKLNDIYRLYACVHVFKIIALNENEVVANTMRLEPAAHGYDTRTRENIRAPFPRTNVVKQSYKFQFVHIWNGVPEDIKRSNSLKIFKRRLSEYFVSFY